ncbi:MAG: DUF4870 domain-containing protein [Trueperaceae bacterium]|nr:DUF4870 domain-containing protein [Trueperaceae bacterium]
MSQFDKNQPPSPPSTPQPSSDIPESARQWATIVHLSAFVGLIGNGVGFVLGPLIVWALKKQDHPFIDEQGKEALNFQLSVFIVGAAAVLLAFTIIGLIIAIPLLIAAAIFAIVFPIMAAVRVNEGEHYRYPITWRFVR